MSLPYEAVPARRELTVRSADGTRLHVEEYGRADGPTVVLSHGWTCSTLFWAPVVRLLAGDYRVVAYDQRGHGRSSVPATREGYGTGVLADDLQAVMEAVLPEGERAVLVGTADKLTPRGHSRGMAAKLPHLVGLTELPGLGHMTPIEDAPAVERVIRELVAAHLTAGSSAGPMEPAPVPVDEGKSA